MTTHAFDEFDRLWIKATVQERRQRTHPTPPKHKVAWTKELTGMAITAGVILGGWKICKLIL